MKYLQSSTPDIMTPQEVAAFLRVPISTIYALAKGRRLPGFKVGKHWRFSRADILQNRMEAMSLVERPPLSPTRRQATSVNVKGTVLLDRETKHALIALEHDRPDREERRERTKPKAVTSMAGALLLCLLSTLSEAATWTHEVSCFVPEDPTATHVTIWKESASSGTRMLDQQIPIDHDAMPIGTLVRFVVKKPSGNAGKWNYYCGSHRDADEETNRPAEDVIKEDAYAGINWKIQPAQ